MAGPWEKYQSAAPAAGPWSKYQSAAPVAAPTAVAPEDVRGPSGVPGGTPAAPEHQVNQGMDAPLYVAQRGDRGLADAAGAPVDLMAGATNLAATGLDKLAGLFGGSFDPRVENPVLGSDWIANLASKLYEGAGGHVVQSEDVSGPVHVAGEAARGAAASLPLAMGLASGPVQASGRLTTLTKPYVADTGATILRDTAAGAGAGVASGSYDQFAPDVVKESAADPFLRLGTAMLGGIGGAGVASVGEGLTRGTGNLARNMVRGSADPSAPVNPNTGAPYSRTEMDNGARVAQSMPTNRAQAVDNIKENTADFAQFANPSETPTVGMLADDIGMAMQENILRSKDAQRFAERDAARRSAASQKVESSAPRGAEGRAFTGEATKQYDDILSAAKQSVEDAVGQQADAKSKVQAQNSQFEEFRARQPQASEALSGEFNAARSAARGEKNARYDAADPATPVDGRFLTEAVDRIDAGMSRAEQMNPGPYAEIAGRVRALTADGQPVTYGDVKALRAQISEARKSAVTASGQSVAGSGADVQRLDDLANVVSHLADEVNPEAARFYREEYAPKFKQGKAGEYGAAADRAVRTGGESSATRPSEFAGKFLRAPEDAASLKRALTPEETAQAKLPGEAPEGPSRGMFPQSEQNVRDWMMGDLAKSGVLTDNAEIRYDRFRQWADKNRKIIDQFPELQKTVDAELATAQKGGMISKQLAQQVAEAKANLGTTEQELRRSALQSAIGNSPENAVASIMGSGDPEKRMTEMVDRLSGNQEATDGLKAAVRDWIKQKAGTTSKIVGDPDTTRFSRANLEKLFNQHEKTLAKLYSPEEMNALRQAHKLLGAEAKLDVRTTSGSNTVDKLNAGRKAEEAQRARLLEAALKAKFGVLKGGGVFRTVSLFLQSLPDSNKGLQDLLFEMQFDPELAQHLLTRPVKEVGGPAWNSRLNALLAAATASRESTAAPTDLGTIQAESAPQ